MLLPIKDLFNKGVIMKRIAEINVLCATKHREWSQKLSARHLGQREYRNRILSTKRLWRG